MKTEPSYIFQHSLLTREVFIMVLGYMVSLSVSLIRCPSFDLVPYLIKDTSI